MKKLLLAMSVFALTFITSCQNSNDEIESQVPVKEQTMKTSARESEMSDEEREAVNSAIEAVEVDDEKSVYSRGPVINCHTSYAHHEGSACVTVGAYTVLVQWDTVQGLTEMSPLGNYMVPGKWFRRYRGSIVSSCNC